MTRLEVRHDPITKFAYIRNVADLVQPGHMILTHFAKDDSFSFAQRARDKVVHVLRKVLHMDIRKRRRKTGAI